LRPRVIIRPNCVPQLSHVNVSMAEPYACLGATGTAWTGNPPASESFAV
jgi:hypothetical protein